MLSNYKSFASEKFISFNFALNQVNRVDDTKTGIINSSFSFKDNYIERLLYDKKHNIISIEDALNDKKDILIYGRRGIGKSLYLMNLFNLNLDNNVFYISCKNSIDDMECERSFNEILKNNAFDIYFEDIKISSDVFDSYISILNNIVIFVDGLDELNSSNKEYLLTSIGQFLNKYKKDIKFIYSSRQQDDADLIHKYTKAGVNAYALELFTNDDILKVFDYVYDNYYYNLSSKVECSDSISKEYFISSLEKISDDIKYTPLLINNVIYSYFVTKKIKYNKFDIISNCLELLYDHILNNTKFGLHYKEYAKPLVIQELLQAVAFENAKGNSRSNHLTTTIVKYFSNLGAKNPQIISSFISNELRDLGIINRNGINNLMLRDYLVGCYLYNFLFMYENESKSIVFKIDAKQLKETFNKYSENSEEWSSISSFLLAKLDSEIRAINEDSKMNSNNKTYNTFDAFLTYVIKKKVFDKNALNVISKMCDNNELYYSDFIKTYL